MVAVLLGCCGATYVLHRMVARPLLRLLGWL